mmetsp:Transcript_13044/g.31926  ORF Transcript_13044/g.31926 Transcript_13044/m.31926 type:complete len:234 (-) Transcript_13044:155-856(-)
MRASSSTSPIWMERDAQPAATAVNTSLCLAAFTGFSTVNFLVSRWLVKYTCDRLSTTTHSSCPSGCTCSVQSRGVPLRWLWYEDSAYIWLVMVYSTTSTASGWSYASTAVLPMPPPCTSTQRVWSLPSNAHAGTASSMDASPPVPLTTPPPSGYKPSGKCALMLTVAATVAPGAAPSAAPRKRSLNALQGGASAARSISPPVLACGTPSDTWCRGTHLGGLTAVLTLAVVVSA